MSCYEIILLFRCSSTKTILLLILKRISTENDINPREFVQPHSTGMSFYHYEEQKNPMFCVANILFQSILSLTLKYRKYNIQEELAKPHQCITLNAKQVGHYFLLIFPFKNCVFISIYILSIVLKS